MAKLTPRFQIQGLDEIQCRFKKGLVEGEIDDAARSFDLKLSVPDLRQPVPVPMR